MPFGSTPFYCFPLAKTNRQLFQLSRTDAICFEIGPRGCNSQWRAFIANLGRNEWIKVRTGQFAPRCSSPPLAFLVRCFSRPISSLTPFPLRHSPHLDAPRRKPQWLRHRVGSISINLWPRAAAFIEKPSKNTRAETNWREKLYPPASTTDLK